MRERHHRYIWYNSSSRQSGGGQASISHRHLGSEVLKRICSQKKTWTDQPTLSLSELSCRRCPADSVAPSPVGGCADPSQSSLCRPQPASHCSCQPMPDKHHIYRSNDICYYIIYQYGTILNTFSNSITYSIVWAIPAETAGNGKDNV